MNIDELERASELLIGRTISALVTREEAAGVAFIVICDDGTTLVCKEAKVEPAPSAPCSCRDPVNAHVSTCRYAESRKA